MTDRNEETALSPSSEELMLRVGRGDRQALAALFGRHGRTVHSLCYRLTGDGAAAEDLLQESFLRVLKYGASFDGRSRFSTWLYRLVRNVCMDHLSARQRDEHRRRRLRSAAGGTRQMPPREDERLDLVRQALDRLAPERREVLVLSRYRDLKYQEIAEILEISVEAVKTRVHRAMRDLRRIFLELEQQA